MFRALLARLRTRFERRDADVDGSPSTFVPSRLDASVLFAHGLRTGEAEREIVDIEERAEALEEQRREE